MGIGKPLDSSISLQLQQKHPGRLIKRRAQCSGRVRRKHGRGEEVEKAEGLGITPQSIQRILGYIECQLLFALLHYTFLSCLVWNTVQHLTDFPKLQPQLKLFMVTLASAFCLAALPRSNTSACLTTKLSHCHQTATPNPRRASVHCNTSRSQTPDPENPANHFLKKFPERRPSLFSIV